MSLAAVLSAVRVLILDCPNLPESYDARIDFFNQNFSSLEKNEIEDLAKIAPEKLSIYTQTIFAGEKSVLSNHFPLTFALIKSKFDSKTDFFELVKDLHLKRPWKSHLTAGLVKGFVEYLEFDRPDILEKIPEISEISKLERLSLQISRKKTEETTNTLPIEDISKLTVAELMEIPCKLAETIKLQNFSFDTASYRQLFLDNEHKLPETAIEKKSIFTIGSRNKWHNVYWNHLSKNVFEFLKENEKNSFSLGELATSYLEGEDQNRSEEELFQSFIQLFSTLLEDGALIIIPGKP